MKKAISGFIICVLTALEIIFAGCAGTNEVAFKDNTFFIDFTADESNKGYVEFYIDKSSELRIAYLSKYIEKSVNDKISRDEMAIGVIGKFNRGTRIRVAEKPGSYTYFIRRGGSVSSVRVDVIEGMFTPVRVNIKNLFEEEILDRIVKFFEINVVPEYSIPFKQDISEKIAKRASN